MELNGEINVDFSQSEGEQLQLLKLQNVQKPHVSRSLQRQEALEHAIKMKTICFKACFKAAQGREICHACSLALLAYACQHARRILCTRRVNSCNHKHFLQKTCLVGSRPPAGPCLFFFGSMDTLPGSDQIQPD